MFRITNSVLRVNDNVTTTDSIAPTPDSTAKRFPRPVVIEQ
jgi:hypothetical protein